jgi:hypothetical protein
MGRLLNTMLEEKVSYRKMGQRRRHYAVPEAGERHGNPGDANPTAAPP